MAALVFLVFQGVLYAGLAAWCTLDPFGTSAALGFDLTSASGVSEYVTVYGGLELGLAAFFFLAASVAAWRVPGVLFALCLYGCLALFRLGTLLFVPGVQGIPVFMFGFETTMFALSALVWWFARGARVPTT